MKFLIDAVWSCESKNAEWGEISQEALLKVWILLKQCRLFLNETTQNSNSNLE